MAVRTEPRGRRRPGLDLGAILSDPALRIPLTYFACAQLLDILTTAIGLVSGLHEFNPVTAAVLHRFGAFGLLLQKVPVVIALALGVGVLPRRVATRVAWAFCGLMAAVIASNAALVLGTR